MHTVRFDNQQIKAEQGQLLSEILMKSAISVEHICGGRGVCKKCAVLVNGKKELSCKYKVESDITVEYISDKNISSVTGAEESGKKTENMCLCLDIGTTTLALALVSLDDKSVVKVITAANPQRIYGADVMTRIDYCNKNGVALLQKAVASEADNMISLLGVDFVDKMLVSGNVTMLHILFGSDCSGLGVAPYKAEFLGSKSVTGKSLGIKRAGELMSLPSIHTFAGADIVAGLNFVQKPDDDKYSLLIDLGTNAEIVLFSRERVVCTSAAAGPCFEGANISCGMSATDGAICSFENGKYKTIGNKRAIGICGTGLVDIIAHLLSEGLIDETGYMEKAFYITPDVVLMPSDVREYQLAKSAVFSAVKVLLDQYRVNGQNLEKVYISGGFSAELNIENAIRTGLLPEEIALKCVAINNSSLLGTVRYACEGDDFSAVIDKAEYMDLSSSTAFPELFIENMMF